MSTGKRLYVRIRECSGCGRTAVNGEQRKEGEPLIVGITPYITRRGSRVPKSAPTVNVCEECLIKATSSGRLTWPNGPERRVWSAIQESLQRCYSGIIERERESA